MIIYFILFFQGPKTIEKFNLKVSPEGKFADSYDENVDPVIHFMSRKFMSDKTLLLFIIFDIRMYSKLIDLFYRFKI